MSKLKKAANKRVWDRYSIPQVEDRTVEVGESIALFTEKEIEAAKDLVMRTLSIPTTNWNTSSSEISKERELIIKLQEENYYLKRKLADLRKEEKVEKAVKKAKKVRKFKPPLSVEDTII